MKLILVPTDMSDTASHALRYASSLAQRLEAHLLVLYADPFVPPSDLSGTTAFAVRREDLIEAAREQLELHVEQNVDPSVPYDARVISQSAVDAILQQLPKGVWVVCAARQIHDGEKVFVGMRLPLIAFALAKRTHAANCVGLFEVGTIRDTPAAELLYTMGDAPNITGALWATGTAKLIGLMAAGEVQLGFIGGAEVDRYGNLNTTAIGNWEKPTVRLPGSGGGSDIASLSHRLAIIMQHDRHRLREKVDFVTSPGHLGGGRPEHWRAVRDDKGRIIVAICHNMDLGDAWEWSDEPVYPAEWANMAYRIAMNYFVYDLSH